METDMEAGPCMGSLRVSLNNHQYHLEVFLKYPIP